MLTDSHCHLASATFSDELGELISRAREKGVERMVSLATCLEDTIQNREIAEVHEEVFFCAGIHPCDVHEAPDDFIGAIEEAMQSSKAVALGETGLDYFHPAPEGWTEDDYRARQRDFLRQHFELAQKLERNVVIHTRDKEGVQSFEDALAIYADFAESVRAVFHCFIGELEAARRVIELGGLVSFTGIATFPKGAEVLAVAKELKVSEFMVETDAPYLAPVPKRGKRNEPAYVAHTAAKIAEAKGMSFEELAAETEETVRAFFQLG